MKSMSKKDATAMCRALRSLQKLKNPTKIQIAATLRLVKDLANVIAMQEDVNLTTDTHL